MKFIRTGALIFIIVFAGLGTGSSQNEGLKHTQPTLLDSFGRIPNGDLKGRMDVFLAELAGAPGSRGLIVSYGNFSELRKREKLIKSHFNFRRNFRPSEVSRIGFAVGGSVSEFRTDVWVIPEGAESPDIKPEAIVAMEFERVYRNVAYGRFDEFFLELAKERENQGYIVNYGTQRQIAVREKWLRQYIGSRRFDSQRVTIVNGGAGEVRTVMWIVPSGAENPLP